jgi:hypothetical protein
MPARYKIEMDIQKALKLLDLEPGATLEDAHAAFKKKAKQFHPDKLMAASKTGDDGERMKDINVAYLTLKPRPAAQAAAPGLPAPGGHGSKMDIPPAGSFRVCPACPARGRSRAPVTPGPFPGRV